MSQIIIILDLMSSIPHKLNHIELICGDSSSLVFDDGVKNRINLPMKKHTNVIKALPHSIENALKIQIIIYK